MVPGLVLDGEVVEDGVLGLLLEGSVLPGVHGVATVVEVPAGVAAPELEAVVLVPIEPDDPAVLPTPELVELPVAGTPVVLDPGEVFVVLQGPEIVPVVVPGVEPAWLEGVVVLCDGVLALELGVVVVVWLGVVVVLCDGVVVVVWEGVVVPIVPVAPGVV